MISKLRKLDLTISSILLIAAIALGVLLPVVFKLPDWTAVIVVAVYIFAYVLWEGILFAIIYAINYISTEFKNTVTTVYNDSEGEENLQKQHDNGTTDEENSYNYKGVNVVLRKCKN